MDKPSRHSTHLSGYLKARKQGSFGESSAASNSCSTHSPSKRASAGPGKLCNDNATESVPLPSPKEKGKKSPQKTVKGAPPTKTHPYQSKPRIPLKTMVESLPDELLVKIFNWCSPSELLCCGQVCKRWAALTADNVLWRRVVSRFPKPVRDALPSLESDDVNWKKAIIERCIKVRDQKALSLLKKVHQYTGLPAATQDVLKMFGTKWLLSITDSSGHVHHTVNSDVFHFATSSSIRWYSFQFPPLSKFNSLQVHALTPVFYEVFSGKWKPQSNSSCKRSLVLDLDMKEVPRLSASKLDGQDDLVTAHILPSGLLVAVYNASWKEGGDVAFISLCLHHNGIIKSSLLGSRNRMFYPPSHKPILDDLDPMYGLHGYSATVEIRNHRTVYWGHKYRELFRSEVNSTHLILRSFAHENGLFSKPLSLPWKTELFKSVLHDMAILDITLLDEHKHLMWCASSPVKVVATCSAEVNYDLEDGKRTFIEYSDDKGTVIIELAWMPEDEQNLVVKVEFRIKLACINHWFGKKY